MTQVRDFFKDRNGELSAEQISLEKLAKKYGTPLYVYSESAFLGPLKRMQFELRSMPATVCFAVKANSNLTILRRMVQNGAGLDLVSGGELERALKVRCPKNRMLFSGVGKTREEIERALRVGIHSFNVESVSELKLIEAVARGLRGSKGSRGSKKKARVALRFNPDVDAKTHPYISTGLKRNKFGLEKNEIFEIVRTFRSSPEIELAGLSVHIGSQILTLKPFADSFQRMGMLAERLKEELGQPLQFLDVGGGLGVMYRNEHPPSVEDYCALIREYFGPQGKFPGYEIFLEPGRQLMANAGVLVSQVLYRKPRRKKDFIVIDAAMNDLMRPSLYGSYHEVIPVKADRRGGKMLRSDVVGPICETADCLAGDRPISSRLREGDHIAIISAGAYGSSMSSQYNSRARAAEVLVKGKTVKLIRKRETIADLIRNEVIL